jgi:hypothetical protein
MSKPDSYYDWELQFRKKAIPSIIELKNQNNKSEFNHTSKNAKITVNSLGIIDEHFKEFMKKWKKNNL